MSSCPDTDALVALAISVEDPEATLRHVLACEECLQTLGIISMLRNMAADETPLPEGYAERVIRSLPEWEARAEVGRVASRESPAWLLANVALSTVTVTLAAAATSIAMPGAYGPALLPLAAAAGLALTMWWERPTQTRDQAPAEA
jgi:hypothetical protein